MTSAKGLIIEGVEALARAGSKAKSAGGAIAKITSKLGIGAAVATGAGVAGSALSSFLNSFGKGDNEDGSINDAMNNVTGGRNFQRNPLKGEPREEFAKFETFKPFTVDKTKNLPIQIDQIVKEINAIKKAQVDGNNDRIKRDKVLYNAIFERYLESQDKVDNKAPQVITNKVDNAINTMLKTFGLLMAAKMVGSGFGGNGEPFETGSGATESPLGTAKNEAIGSSLYAADLAATTGILRPKVIETTSEFFKQLSATELDALYKEGVTGKGTQFFKNGKQIKLVDVQNILKKSKVGINKKAGAMIFSEEVEKLTKEQLKKVTKSSVKEFLLKFPFYPAKFMAGTMKALSVVGIGLTMYDIYERYEKNDKRGILASATELLLSGTAWASALATVFTGGLSGVATVASIMAIIGIEIYKLKRDIFYDYYGVLPESLPEKEYDEKFDELYNALMDEMYDYAKKYFKGNQTKEQLKTNIKLNSEKMSQLDKQIEEMKKKGDNRQVTLLSGKKNDLSNKITSDSKELSLKESLPEQKQEAFIPKPSASDIIAGANNEDAIELVKLQTSNGKSYVVAKKYAANFEGFISDLEATGYKIDSIGGYSPRKNVNRSDVLSDHAFGMAIDINPSRNPNRSTKSDLPPETGKLAAKWGLGWGMNWKSVKDPMHFSIDAREGGIGERADIKGAMPKVVMAKSDTIKTASSTSNVKPMPVSVDSSINSSNQATIKPIVKAQNREANMTPTISPIPNRGDLDRGVYFDRG